MCDKFGQTPRKTENFKHNTEPVQKIPFICGDYCIAKNSFPFLYQFKSRFLWAQYCTNLPTIARFYPAIWRQIEPWLLFSLLSGNYIIQGEKRIRYNNASVTNGFNLVNCRSEFSFWRNCPWNPRTSSWHYFFCFLRQHTTGTKSLSGFLSVCLDIGWCSEIGSLDYEHHPLGEIPLL